MDHFLKRCFYHSGQYSSEDDFIQLDNKLKEKEVIYLFFPRLKPLDRLHIVCLMFDQVKST